MPNFRLVDPPHTQAGDQSRRRSFDQSGGISIWTFLLLFLVAGAIYLTLLYLPPWMAYHAMLDRIQEQVHTAAVTSDEEITNRILTTAKEWELPVTEDDIEIRRSDTQIYIGTQWDVTINIFNGMYQDVLHYAPSTETTVTPRR
ncbi:MAG: hypothetical protein HY208_04925 [Nitrospirae bacterium]|nr:hypothetical protein [Nitrospirota bacterium]